MSKKVMTPQEFADKIRAIEETHGGDNEAMHSEADDLMCKLLREMGYGEGIAIYEEWTRWYA